VPAARLKEFDLAVPDLDESCGRDARSTQEGGMLEGWMAGWLDADVEIVGGVGHEDPLASGGGFADEADEDLLGGHFGGFLLASGGGGVGVCMESDPLDGLESGAGGCATSPVVVKAGVGSLDGTIPAIESFHWTLVSIRMPFFQQHSRPCSSIVVKKSSRSREQFSRLSSFSSPLSSH